MNNYGIASKSRLNSFIRGLKKGMKKLGLNLSHILTYDGLCRYLDHIRVIMEDAWSKDTIYRGTVVERNDPISKGQCGVSAAYLAKQLQLAGFKGIYFCEGNALFPDSRNSIVDHCWVKIDILEEDLFVQKRDLIIDLTADQNGFSDKIIFEENSALNKRGIVYKEISKVLPDEIKSENFIRRTRILTKEVDKIRQKEVGEEHKKKKTLQGKSSKSENCLKDSQLRILTF